MRIVSSLGASMLLLAACSAEQTELSRQISPNQKLVAVLMESVTGGATALVNKEIFLNDQGIPLNHDKPVFSAAGCDRVSFQWANDYTLQIHYETTCAIGHFTNRWFRPSDLAVGRPIPVEIVLIRN